MTTRGNHGRRPRAGRVLLSALGVGTVGIAALGAGGAAQGAAPGTTAFFDSGVLTVLGDGQANSITIGRNTAGAILVNNGAVTITGGTPTVVNTKSILVLAGGGSDIMRVDGANGALPKTSMFGGAGNDSLTGSGDNETLSGQGGNDTIAGGGGTDNVHGGGGNDWLTGGDGDDLVFGEAGNDQMIWNPGDDTDLNEGGGDVDSTVVNGGAAAEAFTTTANGTRVRFDRLDPAPFAIDIGTSENLVVNAKSGNDSFSATGNLAALIAITVDGGGGNDTLLGSNGVDQLLAGTGSDFVDGQQGNDIGFLGGGNDTFQWDPGDGSDTIEGQDGVDTMLFNGSAGSEIFESLANGNRVLFTRNLGNIVMDTDDVEKISLNALGGTDTLTVNDMSGTDLTELSTDLAGTLGSGVGDGAQDVVIVNGTNGSDVAVRVRLRDGVSRHRFGDNSHDEDRRARQRPAGGQRTRR